MMSAIPRGSSFYRQSFNDMCTLYGHIPDVTAFQYGGGLWKVTVRLELDDRVIVGSGQSGTKRDAKESACQSVLAQLSNVCGILEEKEVECDPNAFGSATQLCASELTPFWDAHSNWTLSVRDNRLDTLGESGAIGIDCEWVSGVRPSHGMVCYQLAFMPENIVFVLPPSDLELFRTQLESPTRDIYLFHTATSIYNTPEGKGLSRHNIIPSNVVNIARHQLSSFLGIHPNLPLQALAETILNVTLDKTYQTAFTDDFRKALCDHSCDEKDPRLLYAAADAVATVMIGARLNTILSISTAVQ